MLEEDQAVYVESFWANAGNRCAYDLPNALKVKLLSRSVGPVLDYRCSRRPPQQTIGKEVDTAQCKMAAVVLRIQRLLGEEAQDYCRRRNRAAGALCRRI